MIMEQLGLLAQNSALATANTAKASYCLDLQTAYARPGNAGASLWLVIKTTVVADYASANETYQFILRNGTASDGTDISGGTQRDVLLTAAIAGNDARVSAAGAYIIRIPLPKEIIYRYLQVWKTFGGTTPTISVDIAIVPFEPPSDDNTQFNPSTKAAM